MANLVRTCCCIRPLKAPSFTNVHLLYTPPDGNPTARQEVVEATPCLFLVALDSDELKRVTGRAGGAAGVTRLWLLVAWIPDDSKVMGVRRLGQHCCRVVSCFVSISMRLAYFHFAR